MFRIVCSRQLSQLILAGLVFLPSSIVPAEAATAKPNVLFIAVDDLNTNMSCYGHPLVKTPNIDRLAARGVRFENAQANYPLCNPSRTSLLSGMRPERTRVMDNGTPPRSHLGDALFMPEYFKSHGYYTARAGKIAHGSFERQVKWDAVFRNPAAATSETATAATDGKKGKGGKKGKPGKGVASEAGSEETEGADELADDQGKSDRKANKKARKQAARPADANTSETEPVPGDEDDEAAVVVRNGKRVTFGARPSRRTDAQEADGMTAAWIVNQLEQAKGKREPFFIGCGFHRPHTPYTAPQKYFDMYPLSSIVLPTDEPADDRKDIPEMSLLRNRPDPNLTPEERRVVIQAYYASVSFMDAQAGLVLDALDRLELTSNTVVVFFGDHGQHLGEHGGLYRKTSVYEQADRVPLIYAGPGVSAKGGVSKRPVDLLTLFPTLTELTGLPANPAAEGRSVAKLLQEPTAVWPHNAVTTLAWNGVVGHSIRTERYRYSEWDGGEKGRELFDHQTDPNEYNNLAADPAHSQTVKELHDAIAVEVAPRGSLAAAEQETTATDTKSGKQGRKERRKAKRQP